MAPTVASPTPQPYATNPPVQKDIASLQLHDEGRTEPLRQYEKTQSVPFTLTLQEEKDNPGQFQLVVNIDSEHQKPADKTILKPTGSKKLYANLKDGPKVPSLGYDVSPLYRTQKSSPPTTPQREQQEWSELEAIAPDFLNKVVPDWKVTFSRNDSTASTQSKKLADIKARIKKSGKGFVVRLLKGSADVNEVAEVHLGQQGAENEPQLQEPDPLPAELEATETIHNHSLSTSGVVEIGTSNEPGIQGPLINLFTARDPLVPEWLSQTTMDRRLRYSIAEEGFSDAETLIPDIRSVADQTDVEPLSRNSSVFPTRTTSVSSIVKTPTRGLSVVGPVRRVEKGRRARTKVKEPRSDLNRSGAHRSIKRKSPLGSISGFSAADAFETVDFTSHQAQRRPNLTSRSQTGDFHETTSDDSSIASNYSCDSKTTKQKAPHRSSAEELIQSAKSKSCLRVDTNVPRPKSASSSPVTKRKKSPRTRKAPTFPSISAVSPSGHKQHLPSPVETEADASNDIIEALKRAFGNVPDDSEPFVPQSSIPIPRIEEPVDERNIGEISLPPNLEIRSAPVSTRGPTLTFWTLALSALSEKVFEGLHALRERYGSEPPVPPNHVRVRWTCSCGEQLYDDFVERRPGAARFLEAYLNRPRSHTPTSPNSRSSTSTSMSSVFDSGSRASTLTTPASTYGGPTLWGNSNSKYSPTQLRNTNPFSVNVGSYIDEAWLLTAANEGRFTPKIVHLDVNTGKIRSDKDLALALREHYEQLNQRWLRWMRLRGLTTIEFVQFEVHRNRFADIRATPSMPPTSSPALSTSPEKSSSPSHHPYDFEPVDLMPPVGSAYLIHLFKHPADYDGELITYLRSPKRRERLEIGMGWGINLVEGFMAQKVWGVLLGCFGVGSAVFAIVWTIRDGDIQGAFGVAGWIVTLAGLVLGGLQAWLE